MQALSFDLRQRILAALQARDNRAHIATRFQVSGSSLYRLHRQGKTTGELSPKKRPGRGHALKVEELPALETLVQQQSDPTAASLVQAWKQTRGNTIGLSTMHRALHRLKLSYKKRAVAPASKTPPRGTPSARK